MRDALPHPTAPNLLVRRDATLAFDPALHLALDLDRFEAAATQGLHGSDLATLQRALALYTGPLLPSQPYEDWALKRRAALARLHREVALALAARGEAAAEEPLRAILGEDPADEGAGRALMRLLGAGASERRRCVSTTRSCVPCARNWAWIPAPRRQQCTPPCWSRPPHRAPMMPRAPPLTCRPGPTAVT